MIIGCDFSSSPNCRKPIVVAVGDIYDHTVTLNELMRFNTLAEWGAWLQKSLSWVGGFDFPFGLPRELVTELEWPLDWSACMLHFQGMSRVEIRDTFKKFCNARPSGRKFAHRATDKPAGSSPSMKWVNPPVAFMLHAGMPYVQSADIHIPCLRPLTGASKIALEAYPGMLAREIIGTRSYKSDNNAKTDDCPTHCP